jgi:hypothetical protein
MRLDSARELKTALTEAVVAPLAAPVRVKALGLPAQPVAGTIVPPSLALGIVRQSERDYRLAVRIQQRALEDSPQVDAIRRQARGEVDVRYIGRVVKRAADWHQKRTRPLRIGSSIGHSEVTAGTLGCFVQDRQDDAVLILSNNHVLANENRGRKEDAVLQPGRSHGGEAPADTVATLRRFVRLKRVGVNNVDAAVAVLVEGVAHDARTLTGLGRLAGVGDELPDVGAKVVKIGAATGLTRGSVRAFEMDNLVVEFGIGYLRFDGQVEIDGTEGPFCLGGDSGALIVDAARRGVALLFAGSDVGGANGQGLTYANPLSLVLATLKVDLIC